MSRGEVSSEAPSPRQGEDAVSRPQLRAHRAVRWFFLFHGCAWNLREDFADKGGSALAIQYG